MARKVEKWISLAGEVHDEELPALLDDVFHLALTLIEWIDLYRQIVPDADVDMKKLEPSIENIEGGAARLFEAGEKYINKKFKK